MTASKLARAKPPRSQKNRPRQPGPGSVSVRRPGGRKKALAVMRKARDVPTRHDPALVVRAFWDASLHKVAPPLRTTFGNFATLNVVDRFQFTSETYDTMIWVPWTPSPVACFHITPAEGGEYYMRQRLFGVLAPSTTPGTAVPHSVRPLRSSFRITNLTKAINTASSLQVLSYDNALQAAVIFPSTPSSLMQLRNNTFQSFLSLVTDAPESKIYPSVHFNEPQTFVSVPASWPDYNRYHNFCAFRQQASDNSPVAGGDFYNLAGREITAFAAQPDQSNYPFTSAAYVNVTSGIVDVPPMRGHIIYIPGTDVEQTYEIEFFKQFGARFAANSVGHTFHHTPPPATPSQENSMLQSIQMVSSNASSAIKTAAMDAIAGYAAVSSTVKAIASDASYAVNFLGNVLRPQPMLKMLK